MVTTSQVDLETVGKIPIPPESVISASASERLKAIQKFRWIDNEISSTVLERLRRLYDMPASHRPFCSLVYGDTNSGKTSVCRRFAREINGADADGEPKRWPVLFVQSPPYMDGSALCDALLRSLKAPFGPSWPARRKYDQFLTLAPKAGVRMIILDEIQHFLPAKTDQRSMCLNSLKSLSNELQIPLVAVGTEEALRVFQTDQQLGNRFVPVRMERWDADKKFALFLARMWAGMGFGTNGFRSKDVVVRFHRMADGMMGETWSLMTAVAEDAIAQNKDEVDLDLLDGVRWVSPNMRRKTA